MRIILPLYIKISIDVTITLFLKHISTWAFICSWVVAGTGSLQTGQQHVAGIGVSSISSGFRFRFLILNRLCRLALTFWYVYWIDERALYLSYCFDDKEEIWVKITASRDLHGKNVLFIQLCIVHGSRPPTDFPAITRNPITFSTIF